MNGNTTQTTAATPAVSIIMPAYNAAATLEMAVGCVLAQTMGDWELLLMDDASTDGSAALCDRFAAQDSRVQVHHLTQNAGAGPARNLALEMARGEYVMMMDSDDRADPDLLERALGAAREQGAQTVVWGLTEEYLNAAGEADRSIPVVPPEMVCHTPDEVHAAVLQLESLTLLGYCTNKLYHRETLRQNHIVSPNEPLYEDFFFNAAYAPYITSMVVLPVAPYHYIKWGRGLTARFVPEYFALSVRRVETMMTLCREWNMVDDASRRLLGNIYVRYIFSALQRNCDPRMKMRHASRRAFLQELYTQPLFGDTVPYAAPAGRAAALMSRLLQKRRTTLCLMLGRGIYWVKNRLPRLFVRASH